MRSGKSGCQCGKCVIMPTSRECVCCCEVDRIVTKKGGENEIACIMDHACFEPDNLGGVKCQPSVKCNGYYVADLTPLNHTDSLESFLSILALYFFKQFQFRRQHSLTFQFTNFVDKPKFSYS